MVWKGGSQSIPLLNQFREDLQLDDARDFEVQLSLLRKPEKIQKGVLLGKLPQSRYQGGKLLLFLRINLNLEQWNRQMTGAL